MRDSTPAFKPGDILISFRGEVATVVTSIPSTDWLSRSHKVTVNWFDDRLNPDNNAYYEEVFDLVDGPQRGLPECLVLLSDADALQMVLSFHNLESCTIKYKDGSHITYQAIEYECTACGSHEHADGECICETCDDWDNQAREDHPAECPTCGKDWGR